MGFGCGFGWYPSVLALLTTSSMVLSILSDLDCAFLQVHLPSQPSQGPFSFVEPSLWQLHQQQSPPNHDHRQLNHATTSTQTPSTHIVIGIGLWTYQAPPLTPEPDIDMTANEEDTWITPSPTIAQQDDTHPSSNHATFDTRKCASFHYAKKLEGGITGRHNHYSELLTNIDKKWTLVRISAIFSVFGCILASILLFVDFCTSSKKRHLIRPPDKLLLSILLLTCMAEGIKFGFFSRGIGLCDDSTWLTQQTQPLPPPHPSTDPPLQDKNVFTDDLFSTSWKEDMSLPNQRPTQDKTTTHNNAYPHAPILTNVEGPMEGVTCTIARGKIASITAFSALLFSALLIGLYMCTGTRPERFTRLTPASDESSGWTHGSSSQNGSQPRRISNGETDRSKYENWTTGTRSHWMDQHREDHTRRDSNEKSASAWTRGTQSRM